MRRLACPAALVLLSTFAAVTALAQTDETTANRVPATTRFPLGGHYMFVGARASSLVSSTAREPVTDESPYLLFGSTMHWFDGTTCTHWTPTEVKGIPFDIGDPNLSDLILAPANGNANHQENRLFWLSCGDGMPREIVVVDARTVIVQNADGASYAIFARPFATEEIERLQKALKAEGLYSGDIYGVLDEPTRAALAAYAERRGAAFRFRNPAATMNLLDGLGVLDSAAQ